MKRKLLFFVIALFLGLAIFAFFRVDREAVMCEYKYLFHREDTYLETGYELEIDLDPIHQIDRNYGNWLVHPCVRYIKEGLNGHKWWMACTPYPNANNRYEQPILFYGDGNDTIPPQKWKYVGIVQDWHPEGGYNADPNLFYYDSKLWIFWKEHRTNNTEEQHSFNCIMAKSFDGVKFSDPIRVLNNDDSINVKLTAPIVYEKDSSVFLLATEFEHPRDYSNEDLPFGNSHLAVWELQGREFKKDSFKYRRKALQKYKEGFDFWHTDICQINDTLYASVVTPGHAYEVLIGFSRNGENFDYLSKPLLSSKGNGISRIYKVSLVIVGNTAYLFYPARKGFIKGIEYSTIYCKPFNISTILDTK